MNKNNTSGHTGVYFNKKLNKYSAMVSINKKLKSLGLYYTVKKAAIARDKYIKENNLKNRLSGEEKNGCIEIPEKKTCTL
jgi:hypothetical protein